MLKGQNVMVVKAHPRIFERVLNLRVEDFKTKGIEDDEKGEATYTTVGTMQEFQDFDYNVRNAFFVEAYVAGHISMKPMAPEWDKVVDIVEEFVEMEHEMVARYIRKDEGNILYMRARSIHTWHELLKDLEQYKESAKMSILQVNYLGAR